MHWILSSIKDKKKSHKLSQLSLNPFLSHSLQRSFPAPLTLHSQQTLQRLSPIQLTRSTSLEKNKKRSQGSLFKTPPHAPLSPSLSAERKSPQYTFLSQLTNLTHKSLLPHSLYTPLTLHLTLKKKQKKSHALTLIITGESAAHQNPPPSSLTTPIHLQPIPVSTSSMPCKTTGETPNPSPHHTPPQPFISSSVKTPNLSSKPSPPFPSSSHKSAGESSLQPPPNPKSAATFHPHLHATHEPTKPPPSLKSTNHRRCRPSVARDFFSGRYTLRVLSRGLNRNNFHCKYPIDDFLGQLKVRTPTVLIRRSSYWVLLGTLYNPKARSLRMKNLARFV